MLFAKYLLIGTQFDGNNIGTDTNKNMCKNKAEEDV